MSDRAQRAGESLAVVLRNGLQLPDHSLERMREQWPKAVEWYENRPADGDTNGERLFDCLARFSPTIKEIGWGGLHHNTRGAFSIAASMLRLHGAA